MSNTKQEFWLPVFIKSQMEIPVSHKNRGRKIQEVNKFFFLFGKFLKLRKASPGII